MALAFHDISPELSESTAVFPGDRPFRRAVSQSFARGDNLELSSIDTTLHLGAHADAPSHYRAGGEPIDRRPLERYLGRCQVVSVSTPRGARILPSHLSGELKAPRVLFKTDSFPDPNRWNSDFCSLSPELVEWVRARGVVLVGIDTPSIDPEDSKPLESHGAVAAGDLAVLEGLVLTRVPDGIYTLIALPLRLRDADASPVRAILVEGDAWNG
jgi:arylformamidase